MVTENLKDTVLSLPHGTRAELAEALLSSLDSESTSDTLPQWLEEAASRFEAYKEGKLTATEYHEALDRVENTLR